MSNTDLDRLREELADAREEIENFKLCERIPCVHEERLIQTRAALEKIVTLALNTLNQLKPVDEP